MARFDLFRIDGVDGYVLEVQANQMVDLATTVVVPLLSTRATSRPLTRLNPTFEIDGERFVMVTQSIGAVPRRELGAPVGSLDHRHGDIMDALDMLLTGY